MAKKQDAAETIFKLAEDYRTKLKQKIDDRKEEMKNDQTLHYEIYSVLGIDSKKGNQIDIYQNIGRFLYNYAGSFLEEAAIICFKTKYPETAKIKIPNTISQRPKTFEIDCLVGKKAYEIKWRDATTDGDHIAKEHTRIQNIKNAGYTPVRIMFYEPNRKQAKRIQAKLKNLYAEIKGEYYSGAAAWQYIFDVTEVDFKSIIRAVSQKTKPMDI